MYDYKVIFRFTDDTTEEYYGTGRPTASKEEYIITAGDGTQLVVLKNRVKSFQVITETDFISK